MVHGRDLDFRRMGPLPMWCWDSEKSNVAGGQVCQLSSALCSNHCSGDLRTKGVHWELRNVEKTSSASLDHLPSAIHTLLSSSRLRQTLHTNISPKPLPYTRTRTPLVDKLVGVDEIDAEFVREPLGRWPAPSSSRTSSRFL